VVERLMSFIPFYKEELRSDLIDERRVLDLCSTWAIAREHARLIFFLVAGAALGATQTLVPLSIFPQYSGLVPLTAGFCVGAVIHWFIAVRQS
jgi:hypothetical protein